jgi:hypothetical protein
MGMADLLHIEQIYRFLDWLINGNGRSITHRTDLPFLRRAYQWEWQIYGSIRNVWEMYDDKGNVFNVFVLYDVLVCVQ